MSTIVTRAGKGSALTNTEVDSNFTNLNTDKIEAGTTVTLTNKTINLTSNTLVATSAQLASAVTDETGTGSLVFATSPTLVTPALGTPSSGVVTNLTGTASININGTVGATTATTGAFTTVSATGAVTTDASFTARSSGTSAGIFGSGLQIGGSGNDLVIYGQKAGNIKLYPNTTEVANFASTGLAITGTLSASGVSTLTGGAQVIGSISGYGGGEVLLGPTTSGAQSAISTQATGTPTITFDHRGTSNTGTFLWRNGTSAASELMRLTSTGLGIGTSSPSYKLDVQGGNLRLQTEGAVTKFETFAYSSTQTFHDARWTAWRARGTAASPSVVVAGDELSAWEISGYNGSSSFTYAAGIRVYATGTISGTTVPTYMTFETNSGASASERLRITSAGDVGIGTTSPATKVDARGVISAMSTGVDGTFQPAFNATYSGDTLFYGTIAHSMSSIATSSGFRFLGGGTSNITGTGGQQKLLDITRGQTIFYTGDTERMRLDSAGNLGLGVTPSANTLSKGLDLVGGAGLWGVSNQTELTCNAYYNGGWRYKATAFAGLYQMQSGQHQWNIAPSGTIDNLITFTQAMTLDASGNLGVGTTGGTDRLYVERNYNGSTWVRVNNTDTGSGAAAGVLFKNDIGDHGAISSLSAANSPASSLFMRTIGAYPVTFGTNNTERARITSAGAWSFGSSGTNTGTAGQVLTSGGSGAAPTWSTPSGISTGKAIAMAIVFGG